MTLSAASTLLEVAPASPDRLRAVLYISNRCDTERGRALASLFARAAQQARVMVFAVNAAALGPPRDSTGVDADDWKQVVASRRQTLRALAEPTGGGAFLDDVYVGDTLSRVRGAIVK